VLCRLLPWASRSMRQFKRPLMPLPRLPQNLSLQRRASEL